MRQWITLSQHLSETIEMIDEIRSGEPQGQGDITRLDNVIARQYEQDNYVPFAEFAWKGQTIRLLAKQGFAGKGERLCITDDEDVPLGALLMVKSDSGAWITHSTHLRSTHTGQGLGHALYMVLLNRGLRLRTDRDHSPGARALWGKLCRDPSLQHAIYDADGVLEPSAAFDDAYLDHDAYIEVWK